MILYILNAGLDEAKISRIKSRNFFSTFFFIVSSPFHRNRIYFEFRTDDGGMPIKSAHRRRHYYVNSLETSFCLYFLDFYT